MNATQMYNLKIGDMLESTNGFYKVTKEYDPFTNTWQVVECEYTDYGFIEIGAPYSVTKTDLAKRYTI